MRATDSLQEFIAPLQTVLALRIGKVPASRSLLSKVRKPRGRQGFEPLECSLRRLLAWVRYSWSIRRRCGADEPPGPS